MNDSYLDKIASIPGRVRRERPLIHHITNMVVMNDTANITLFIGASPVMAHAAEEVAEMVSMARALVLNIGTLTPGLVDAMLVAGKRANELGVPVVLDPVGAGATRLRTDSARRLLTGLKIDILRGNAAEISILGGRDAEVKGVDAAGIRGNAAEIARDVAREYGLVVAITGKRDFVSDGNKIAVVDNGHALMGNLTGTGCMSTSIVAAFAAVERDYMLAAAGALALFGVAGELAAEKSSLPGSFKTAIFDEVYNMNEDTLRARARVQVFEASEADRL
ncbi:MAG TPA: hydroxyethylthiazole kinase [Firmicutes bacterium]|nr:hydroxyethylthiazole kinase [Bacillota bacterium]